jgi:hypothetical protein
LLARLLLEFPLRDSSLLGERISQLSLRQNTDVTGEIDCRSLPMEGQKVQAEQETET